MATAIDWDTVHAETLGIFKDLLRIDTTNPPGNERPAAEAIGRILAAEGIDFTIVESEPTRASLVARLRGSGRKAPLLLSAHLDVVPADPEHWTHDPFGAVEADGYVWGRGALDMKNMAAMSLVTMLLLQRQGIALDRDVIFAAVADEEAGMHHGSLFLVERHPELVRAEYVLTEVGGHTMHLGTERLYPIQIAERGICWLELVAHGEPGHGSMPHPKNPVVRLAKAVSDLGATRLPQHPTPVVERFLDSLASAAPFPGNYLLPLLTNPALSGPILALFERVDPVQAMGLNALLRNTASPTMLAAGRKINVIPSSASVRVDGRILPGESKETFLDEIRAVVGDDIEIRVLEHHEGSVFEPATELFEVIEAVVTGEDPGARCVPCMIPGFTDASAYSKLGATCYGFSPLRLPPDLPFARLYHGHDERVPVEGFAWGTRVLYEVVRLFCGAVEPPGA